MSLHDQHRDGLAHDLPGLVRSGLGRRRDGPDVLGESGVVREDLTRSFGAASGTASNRMRTSQMAFPREVSEAVYADAAYAGSADSLAQLSLESDSVFADGHSLQLARMTGSVGEGLTASLAVPV